MLSGRRAWEGRTCDPQTPYPREGRGGTPPVMARQSPRLSPPTVTHQAGASLSLTCAVSSPRSFLAFISQMKRFAPLAAGFSFPVLATAPAFTGVALAMLASTPVTSCCLRPMLPLANPSRARLGGGVMPHKPFLPCTAPRYLPSRRGEASSARPRPWGGRDSSGGGQEHPALSEAGRGIRARTPWSPSPAARSHAGPGCAQAGRFEGTSPGRGLLQDSEGCHLHPADPSAI